MTKAIEPDPYFPDDPEEVKEKKSKKPVRYAVGLRSDTDRCCYKDFFETGNLDEAKEVAAKAVAKHKKGVIIWERGWIIDIIQRYEPPAKEGTTEEKIPEAKPKKGKRK